MSNIAPLLRAAYVVRDFNMREGLQDWFESARDVINAFGVEAQDAEFIFRASPNAVLNLASANYCLWSTEDGNLATDCCAEHDLRKSDIENMQFCPYCGKELILVEET